ncbi:MAG: 6-bladed beta-propeller [Candidatus Cloacimonetes bacterium]|nr:6-bladed beta-propeller [Candidatus Cloacimonadota bacterium]
MYRIIIIILITLISVSLSAKNEIRFHNLGCDKIIERGDDRELATETIWELESSDDFDGFSWVTKIKYYKDKLYVLDQEQMIHVFDTEGNYLKTYGCNGKGPGEIVLVKDIDLHNDFIYQLDKGKYTLSKFDLNYQFIWEKKLPMVFSEKSSPEEIEVNDNGIFLSGFSTNYRLKEVPILYNFSEDMELISESLSLSPESNDAYGTLFRTANRMTSDNNFIYLGLMGSIDYLYAWNFRNNKIEFLVNKETPANGKYELRKHASGGTELMCYFSCLDMGASMNYLVCGENAGAYTKENDKISVPDGYKNNAAIYKKNGEYVGSVFLDLPYEYSSFSVELEERDNRLYVYLFSDSDLVLRKIEILNIN